MQLLLDEQTDNGSSSAIAFSPTLYNLGKGTVIAFGTWDTATVTFQFSPNNTDWYTFSTDTTFTEDGWSNFEINGSVYIRATLSSVGDNTSVSFGIL